jgi:hypothetical protein
MKWIEVGINPSRFVGVNYVARMYALRKDPRPMIQIHALFFVVWIKMPWRHVMSKDFGSKVCSWGFVVRLAPWYYHINKG